MKFHIHRGQNQIGGNIIEISTDRTKILLDAGLELDGGDDAPLPKIEGLFDWAGYDAVFVSHYHSDHMGLIYNIHKDIPVYIGEGSYNIIKASDNYKNKPTIMPRGFLYNKKSITVGDITVTPYLCDHSAFDSYMLLCEANGERILYTGDFRSNGRKSFDTLLKALPRNIDKLICEGTLLSRENYVAVTEYDLEEKATDIFRKNNGPVFVLQSSMNIDRLVTMYRGAKRSNRIFLEDVYAADIASAAGNSIPNPDFSDVYAFITSPSKYHLFEKYKHKVGKEFISQSNFVMCVRCSMLGYLKSLAEKMSFKNGVLVYSFWSGYRESEDMKRFLNEFEKMGLEIVTLHTSGHADEGAIKRLVETVDPKVVVPVHTENARRFKEILPNVTVEL
ncbi:MAG: MBL fold metallo-hydrolase [Clostridia bacterium]|nr:MBL fold metallo-hydrolase [Clostridia bacterium]